VYNATFFSGNQSLKKLGDLDSSGALTKLVIVLLMSIPLWKAAGLTISDPTQFPNHVSSLPIEKRGMASCFIAVVGFDSGTI
jgi:hypothetical protein